MQIDENSQSLCLSTSFLQLLHSTLSTQLPFFAPHTTQMSSSGPKRKASASGPSGSGTKKARGKTNASSSAAAGGHGTGEPGEKRGILPSGRRKNPHGIAPDDVDESAKPTQVRNSCFIYTVSKSFPSALSNATFVC
jgi:hypothetical protein